VPEASELILVVEDDPEVRRFLRAYLTNTGYKVYEAVCADQALKLAAEKNPDVVILDLGLPDMDGVDVAKRLREWCQTPIIVLSARNQETEKVKALDAGADDYLTKPFGVQELSARLRVALRHARAKTNDNESIFTVGNICVDLASRVVCVDDQEVHLSPIEYKLLHLLIENAERVVTQQQILRQVWGPGCQQESHYLRVYMAQLRRKLEKDPAHPRYLITEPGVGCRFRMGNAQ
jgi:two-component system KDP operon response regulator KdpE